MDGKYIKLISAAFKRMNYINAINDERLNKNIFIHYFDESLKPKISNEIKDKNDNSDTINFGKNILKLFIILYLHYEELNENINKEIKSNSNEKYFLINGEFIKKYKEHYNYQQIINKLQNDENVKSVFSKNKKQILDCVKNKKNYGTNISLIVQQFKDEFILELGNKRKNQNELKHNLVNNNSIKFKKAQTTSRLILVYFDGQEMVNSEFIELFKKIEDEQMIQLLIAQEITCLLGEKKYL